jgi:hypothetical protein
VFLWSAFTAIYLLVISVLILRDDRFALNLGMVRTTGRAGLWVTLLPGVVGLLALLLVTRRTRAGAFLLGLYSMFWAVVLGLALPSIWNAQSSFCIKSFCIRTPWMGRLLLFALATPFLLTAVWARVEAARGRHRLASV